jgi:hypothetical protein
LKTEQQSLPRKDIIGSCLQMKIVDFAPFDAGFDIEATYPKKIFVGVKEGSNAYLAGMRNGQKWVEGRDRARSKRTGRIRCRRIRHTKNHKILSGRR